MTSVIMNKMKKRFRLDSILDETRTHKPTHTHSNDGGEGGHFKEFSKRGDRRDEPGESSDQLREL